jgi:CheY-like chemotaxis protein
MDDSIDTAFASALSRMRYELRTPVGHIIGYAELMSEEWPDLISEEFKRDLHVIASSGERLVSMVEEHLGAAKRSLEDLDLPAAQFHLRMQLNHIAGYTEMLLETVEEESHVNLAEDLEKIADAERQMLELLDQRLIPDAFAADSPLELDTPVGSVERAFEIDELAVGGRLLVVDSNPTSLDLHGRRLSRHGFAVAAAASGQEALAHAQTGTVDLILMDLLLDGLSGLETLKRLKASSVTRDTPVIILSAVDDLDQMVECVLAGAEDYLISPIRPILLLARIAASLEMVQLRRRMARQLRIFISSPGDVIPERRALRQVIQQLDDEYGYDVQLIPILWEEEPLVASETFQSQIIEPHDTDIYVAILWSRIGSPLPDTIRREDGSRYESGTAYEFEDAMRGFRNVGRPHMLVYRKKGFPSVELRDRAAVLDRLDQMDKLGAYLDRWFRGDDGSYVAAFHEFSEPEELESMTALHLRKLIDRSLNSELTGDRDVGGLAPARDTGE